MKFEFFNDTGKEMRIHPATKIHGIEYEGKDSILPLTIKVFRLPENTTPLVKLWERGTILVTTGSGENA